MDALRSASTTTTQTHGDVGHFRPCPRGSYGKAMGGQLRDGCHNTARLGPSSCSGRPAALRAACERSSSSVNGAVIGGGERHIQKFHQGSSISDHRVSLIPQQSVMIAHLLIALNPHLNGSQLYKHACTPASSRPHLKSNFKGAGLLGIFVAFPVFWSADRSADRSRGVGAYHKTNEGQRKFLPRI